jgi:rubrerythrin
MKNLPSEDLKKVIDYLYPHEERHFMECLANLQESDESDGTIKRHIFPSIKRLKEWLDEQQS